MADIYDENEKNESSEDIEDDEDYEDEVIEDEELDEDYVDDSNVDDLGDYEAYDDEAEEHNSSPEVSEEVRSANRKSRHKAVLALLIVMVICAVVAAASVFVFLRVKTITVSGSTKYTANQIVESCGVSSGDNLFLLKESDIENTLTTAFPYVESVKISKQYPSELKIVITESEPRYSVPYDGMYVYVSSSGKMLEKANARAINSIILTGGSIHDENGCLVFDDDSIERVYTQINEYLNERTTKITAIDISDAYDIKIKYDDRVILEVGGPSDLRYKLNFGLQIVSGDGIGENEYGRLDLTLSTESSKAYFTPTSSEDVNGEQSLTDSKETWTDTFSGAGRVIDGVDVVEAATPDPSLANETPAPRDETGAVITPEPTEEPTPEPTAVPFARGDDIPDA